MNQTGQMLMHHHIFPDEGGFNDQDAEWTDAFFNWMGYWHYLEAELQPEVEARRSLTQRRSADDLLADSFDSQSSPDWQTLYGD